MPSLKSSKSAFHGAKIVKKAVTIARHRTTVSLEEGFWQAAHVICDQDKISLNELVKTVDQAREKSDDAQNLSSALRIYILNWFQD